MPSIKRPTVTRYHTADGRRCGRSTPGATPRTTQARKFYAYHVPGSSRPIPLCTDEGVARRMLARLVADGESALAGFATTTNAHALHRLQEEFDGHLRARGVTDQHRATKLARLARALAGCGWTHARHLDAHALEDWLAAEARRRHWSPQSRNHYLTVCRSFARWLVRRRLLPSDPFAALAPVRLAGDLRRDRRALTPEELQCLLEHTADESRRLLYLVAAATGFRARELASLTPASLLLDESPPVALLASRTDKRRKPVRQPLPPEVVPLLRSYCVRRPQGAPLWSGSWYQHAARMLRADLAAAGIPYVVAGPDGPLYADFHSLRHTFVSLLERSGVSLRDAMHLARHSDPRLTLARYGRPQLADLGRAVAGLVAPVVALPDAETHESARERTKTEARKTTPRASRKGKPGRQDVVD